MKKVKVIFGEVDIDFIQPINEKVYVFPEIYLKINLERYKRFIDRVKKK